MNYVGSHFGGSLFSMTDPFWMMMVLHNIGPGHMVWDKSGEFDFRKLVSGTLTCAIELEEKRVDDLRVSVARDGKATMWFRVDILVSTGDIVATIRKEVYVRAKDRSPETTRVVPATDGDRLLAAAAAWGANEQEH